MRRDLKLGRRQREDEGTTGRDTAHGCVLLGGEVVGRELDAERSAATPAQTQGIFGEPSAWKQGLKLM